MNPIVLKDKQEVIKKVALMLFSEIEKNSLLTLGLASGRTMKPIYQEFVQLARDNHLDTSRIKTFNLDEYIFERKVKGRSIKNFMKHYFFRPLKLREDQINLLKDGNNRKKICKDYEKSIRLLGGINLQLLGIGRNGHIAFNEPGSSIKSRCRIVNLKKTTREDVIKTFGSLKNVPQKAVTLGIKDILESKKIILVAFGSEKAEVIKKIVEGPITKKVPASFLRKHSNISIIIDRAAGRLLKR